MSCDLHIEQRFSSIDSRAYGDLWLSAGSPAFYHPAFLRAAESSPLLPVDEVAYLCAWNAGRLDAFLPLYRQRTSDPFGSLSRSTGLDFGDPRGALLGHIAHCYDSRLLRRPGAPDHSAAMLTGARQLAEELDVAVCGLVNVGADATPTVDEGLGYVVNFMQDRFRIDLRPYGDLDGYVAGLPKPGRHEMRRQLRKFTGERGFAQWFQVEHADLERVARLCHGTSAKNGTPQYYPERAFREFVVALGDLASILVLGVRGEPVGAAVCLHEPGKLHMWAGGMTYEQSEFSPYSVLFAEAVRHALANGIELIEAGRTNAPIKARLGCTPLALNSILHVNPRR